MKAIVIVLRDVLILGAFGAGIALGVNASRDKGSVELTKAYFVQASPKKPTVEEPAKPVVTPPVATPVATPTVQPEVKDPPPTETAAAPIETTHDTPVEDQPVDVPLFQQLASVSDRALEQGYKVVTHDEVVAIFDHPSTEMGLNVIVDARNDTAFEEGHIPGAWQVYHYELERYIDAVLPVLQGAEIVVVYCNGGDCEDSGLVCGDLNEAGIDYDRLFLYKQGWEEWKTRNMPIETGRSIAIGDE